MTSEANFRLIRNSLGKEQRTKDIESGPVSPSSRNLSAAIPARQASDNLDATGPAPTNAVGVGPASQSRLPKVVFTQLLQKIREKQYHLDSEKQSVYTKLMNHLDAVEETHRKSTSILVLAEILVFSGLLTALICSLTMERIKHRRFLRLRMWQYVAMVMMIVSGLSVVRFLTFVVSWPVKRWWRIHKYVVYFIRQLKRCVDVTIWFCIVLLGWYLWFRPRLRHVHGDLSVVVAHQVTRFLIALCLGSFLWLLKNVLYLKLEADLHYDQLFERVRLSVLYLHGLQIVNNVGMWRFLPDNKTKKRIKMARRKREEIKKDDQMKGENIWMLVMMMEKESAPIWILRRLAEEYLDQLKLRPLPGNSDITKDDQKILKEAQKMFKQLIQKRIKKPDHFSDLEIERKDLEELYGLDVKELDFIFTPVKQEEEDDDENKNENENETQAKSSGTPGERTICYDEFLNWAVRAYKNCWGLERTLNSSKRVFIKLNRLLSTFLLMVVLIIWLLLSGIVDTGQLALLFTPFLAASFIFGDSCRKMFEGLIFAFAMHPFDVGDRVIINNVQMRVTEMNILTSMFHKYDTGEEVITPNSALTTTSIINLDITPDQSDKIEFVVSALTPLEDIMDLEIKIKKFLDDDIEYSSNNKVVKSEIGKEEMKITVYFKYLVSYLTAESKAVHKSKILSKIMKFGKDMEKNSKEFPSSHEPYIVDIVLTGKVKLKDITDLQAEIMSQLAERYKPYSKVVITELKKSEVKMGLYMSYLDYTKKEHIKREKNEEEEAKKNLEEISKTLAKRGEKSVVREVKIRQPANNGEGEVIVQVVLGWDRVQASQVNETQDKPSASVEPIPTGGMMYDNAQVLLVEQEGQAILPEESTNKTEGK